MARKNTHSRVLRQLAEDLLARVAGESELTDDERGEFTTSLVRQWVTYDGNAVLFFGDRQFYLVLGRTPLGRPVVTPEPALPGWVRDLTRDWKVDPDELPGVFEQLNRGQSAEVTNGEGVPLRLWVDPKERSRGVEPLVKEAVPAVIKRDYRKLAASELGRHLGEAVDPEELDALARSVAGQWQRHGGHASVFLDEREELALTFAEEGGGMCCVRVAGRTVDLNRALVSVGLPPEAVPEVVARINLGQQVEFRDRQGAHSRLRYDPRARQFFVDPLGPVPPPSAPSLPPFLCPHCTAVLMPWQEGQRQQTCPICGRPVTRR